MKITTSNILQKNNLQLILTVLLVICVGIASTSYLFMYFTNTDKDKVNARVYEGVIDLIPSTNLWGPIDPARNLFNNTFIEITSSIQNPSEITNDLLKSYYTEDFEDLIYNVSLRYIKKSDYLQNEQAITHTTDNPFINVENAEYQATYGISDKDRLYSYKITNYFGTEGLQAPSMDFYGDPTFQIAMDIARDTGKTTHRHSIPFYDEKLLAEYFYIPKLEHYFYPVYDSLLPSDDLGTRRKKLDGFLSVMYESIGSSLNNKNLPKNGVTAVFLPNDPNLTSSLMAKKIKTRLDKKEFITLTNEDRWLEEYIPEDYVVIAKASESFKDSLISSTRWWALALGLFLTTWVSSLIIWAQTKTQRVMKLVDIRTHELKEKTQKLENSHAALNRSETRYRMLANNISDVIFTHDMDGICTYMSPSVLMQTGYPPEEYLGKPIKHYFGADNEEVIAQGISETIRYVQTTPDKNLSSHPYLFRSTNKDGTRKWYESAISTLKTEKGNPEGFLGVSRDITARIEAEQEKEKMEAEFRQSQKMEAIGNLAGGVAHDFNNLLTGILGHADMMKLERPLSPTHKRSLGVIENAALRARDLTSQLLGFARKGQYVSVLVDLNQVVKEIISLMERTVDKRIVIRLETQDTIPFVMGDLGQLNQVILNMAVNSRDAMPEGGQLIFRTSVEKLGSEITHLHNDLKPGVYSHISISDTGHGIPADIIDKIFDPFFTNKEEGKGTGMGLAMAYGVIRNHGGFIQVKSEAGKGAIFDIYLPYSTSYNAENEADSADMGTGSGKVLFVDDEDLIRDLATTMLNRLGYDVITAENGAVGIETYRKHGQEISFVIVDIIMPEVDGIDCLRELRKINPDLKAILTTGYSRESVADKLNENLAQEFLEKPFRLKTLAAAITALFDETSDISV